MWEGVKSKMESSAAPAAAAPVVVDTLADFQSDPVLCTALYRHVANCPPHGAYARLVAITFATYVRQEYNILLSPHVVLQFLRAHWMLEHMRAYAPLYVASDISSVDVEKISVMHRAPSQ
jgi:hypothetical protein